MKTVIIHGQSHAGSTCMVERELAEKVGWEVQATKPGEIPAGIQKKIHRKTDALARRILQNAGQQGCNSRGKFWFAMMGFAQKHFPPMEPDYGYWEQQGWHRGGRPWK